MKAGLVRAICILLVICAILTVSGCGKTSEPKASGLGLIHEPEFGGIYITMTIDEFNDQGFEYGDSVKVAFSNGYVLEDVPYYNGYYVKNSGMQEAQLSALMAKLVG